MAVRDILLDTNAYAAFKRGLLEAVEVIAHAPRIGINCIVLGDLLKGSAERAYRPPALALVPAQAIGRTRSETPAWYVRS